MRTKQQAQQVIVEHIKKNNQWKNDEVRSTSDESKLLIRTSLIVTRT